jgi:hypothetical protein
MHLVDAGVTQSLQQIFSVVRSLVGQANLVSEGKVEQATWPYHLCLLVGCSETLGNGGKTNRVSCWNGSEAGAGGGKGAIYNGVLFVLEGEKLVIT